MPLSTGRVCGSCQLCCRLMPVRSLGKPGWKRCKHQKFGVGCKVYRDLESISPECRLWNCRWLVNDDTDDLHRPDRSHYVIDIMPDFVTLVDLSGNERHLPAIQIWVDENYPDAHRDPALRAYLSRQGEIDSSVAIIRSGSSEGFVLIPPTMMEDHQWHEHRGDPPGEPHSVGEIVSALFGEG